MDRSSTPRASQQQQRQQGSSSSNNNTQYGNIGIGQRRGKNRSRSGSEELSQIIAEAQAAQRARNEQKSNSNGFWPLSNGFSRPTSVTPTPHNLNGDGHLDEHTEGEQSRTTSPGLLSWVRNAIMLGPSGRAIPLDENNDPVSQRNRFSPTDPIKRNQTPLLPGTIPSFHHIDRQRTLEPPLVIRERPRSERSSISFDGASSAGHDSLESYDYSASIRRSSTISSISTSSSTVDSFHRRSGTDATINDTEDDDSDQEDIYAPFAQRQHGPSLIRPTARREALGFGPPSPPTSAPQNEFQSRTPSTVLGHGYGITGSEHNLNISEAAQESGQTYVTDTEEQRTVPSVVVSTASPQLTSQELEPNTPISGWVEANYSESTTPKPAERVVQSTESANRLAEISAGKQAGTDLTEIVHDIDSLDIAKRPQSHVHGKGHHTFEESSIDTTFTGDGEDLNDTLGRPKSPEELIRLRQSRERVVLGSQGANTRAGQAAPIRRARAASVAKELNQKYASPPTKTADVASNEGPATETGKPTMLQRSVSSSKALTDSRSARINSGSKEPSPSPYKGRKEASEELKSPKGNTRIRRPLGFLSKRRDISESSVDSTHSHSRSASLTVVDSLPDLKKENTPFWRLGMGRDKRNVSSQEASRNKDTEKIVKENKEGDALSNLKEMGAKPEQESVPSLGKKSAQKCTLLPDDKAHKSYRLGALKGEVKPRRIRVRHRNKPTKEREFSNIYLVQELHLGGRAAANANTGSSPSGSPMLKPQRGMTSTSQTSLTGSDSGQNAASGKRKATWVMKFSLDGKYLAVAGQDAVIRVFGVLDSPATRLTALQLTKEVNPSEPVPGSPRTKDTDLSVSEDKHRTESEAEVDQNNDWGHEVDSGLVFTPDPIKEFKGHTSDILDLSWSKGGFLLSASMDKTARVWHLSWPNNLVAFVHGDFVTSAVFHPRDDRFFLSGSLDGKLRLWNISTKKVQASQEVPGLITACAFTHSGNTACVGTFSGAALFYQTDGLVFSSSVAVRSASGKHQKGGRKITAIEPILTEDAFSTISNLDDKGEQQSSLQTTSERVLITSNDSRVRAFDIGSKSMIVRYKAKTYTNRSSQIRATLSDDNTFILAGSEATSSSEGGQVHIWASAANLFDVSQKGLLSKLASGGMNAVAAANQKTTSLLRSGSRKGTGEKTKNRPSTAKEEKKVQKNKDRSDVILEDSVEYFTAHAGTVTCAIMAPALSNSHLRKANDPMLSMSEDKIQQRLANSSMGETEGFAQFGRTISAAMTSPLRIASGGSQSSSAVASPTTPFAIAQSISISNKVNRIIVTVDDQAIVRVWRNDSLAVLAPSNGKGK